jgi:hypothetical protein
MESAEGSGRFESERRGAAPRAVIQAVLMRRPPFNQYNRFLAHYTSRYAALAHILPQQLVRLSPFGLMRDPLEAKDLYIALAPASTLPTGSPFPPLTYESIHRELNEGVSHILKQEFKLLSMTADDAPSPAGGFPAGEGHFGRCYARPRMWEQYAEGHRGLCLLFNHDRLIEEVSAALRNRQWFRHRPVSYRPMSAGLRADPHLEWEAVLSQPMDALIASLVEKRAPESFFEKFDDYASEQEYRFVVRAPEEQFLQIDFGQSLGGVVIGAEFPDAELRPLIFLCARLGTALLRMEWRQGLGQIAGFYNPTIPLEHNHAAEIAPYRDELSKWHPSLADYEAHIGGSG